MVVPDEYCSRLKATARASFINRCRLKAATEKNITQ